LISALAAVWFRISPPRSGSRARSDKREGSSMSRTSQSSTWSARSTVFAVCAVTVVALLTPQSSRADGRLWIGGLCVDTNGGHAFLAACVAGKPSQMWRWENADKREYNTSLGFHFRTATQRRAWSISNMENAWTHGVASSTPVTRLACIPAKTKQTRCGTKVLACLRSATGERPQSSASQYPTPTLKSISGSSSGTAQTRRNRLQTFAGEVRLSGPKILGAFSHSTTVKI
jgi:hypothetical protein